MIQRSGGVEGLVLAEQPRRWPSSFSDGVEVYSLSPLCVKRTQVDEAAAFFGWENPFCKKARKSPKSPKKPDASVERPSVKYPLAGNSSPNASRGATSQKIRIDYSYPGV